MTLPPDENDICTTCKEMVKEARDQLQSNETQEEIREVLEGTCRIYFPIKVLAEECIKYVDEFIPELIEMLSERMDPQLVCSTAGLCNARRLRILVGKEKPKFSDPTPGECQDCKKFVQDANAMIKNASKADVQKKLVALCERLGPYAQFCKSMVLQEFEMIYRFLSSDPDPNEMCQLFGMCDEVTNVPVMQSLVEVFARSRDPDPECQFCEQLVQHLKDMITSNSTEEEVKELFLGFCKNLGSFEKQCEDFINENFQEIYDFLTDEMDPHLVCNALGLCPNGNSKSTIHLAKLKPAEKMVGRPGSGDSDSPLTPQLDSNAIPGSAQVAEEKVHTKLPFSRKAQLPQTPESLQLPETRLIPQTMILGGRSPVTCALCEYALHELQNILMENKTEAAIKAALDRLCALLPSTINDECQAFVAQYGDAILALLAQQIDPSQVCVKLKICDGKDSDEKVHVKTKFPFQKAVDAMKQGTTISFDPANVQLPIQRLMPQVVAEASQVVAEVSQKGSDSCEICQFVMGVMHMMLADNKTKEAIEHALEEVCTKLPEKVQAPCKAFVDEYGDELLTLLQTADPSVVCALLQLCSSSPGTVPIRELRMTQCDTCQLVVDYVDKLLEEQTVEEDITKVLEKVCGVVPPAIRDQCQTIIETYGPYLLQLLGQLADSKKVCQAIDLCARPAGEAHLIGGNKCLYGPSYWCQTKIHARACKAEKHCKNHVWKN